MNQSKTTENLFYEGVRMDQSEVDATPKAATDIVNGTLLSKSGDQLITQILKSNAPVAQELPNTTIHEKSGYHYYVQTFTDLEGIYAVSFKITEMDLAVEYIDIVVKDTLNQETDNFRLERASIDTSKEFFLETDGKNISRVSFISNGSDFSYTLFAKAYKLDKAKLAQNQQILGLATYNDIAYIISGTKTEVQLEKKAANNVATRPTYSLGPDDDSRGITHESVDKIYQGEVPEDLVRLDLGHRYLYGDWVSRKRTETIESVVVPISVLGSVGSYTFNFEIEASNRHNSDTDKHVLEYRFLLGVNPITEWRKESRDNSYIKIQGSRSITTTITDTQLSIETKGSVRDKGKINWVVVMNVTYISGPTIVEESAGIEISHTKLPATSYMHANGSIYVEKSNFDVSISPDYLVSIGTNSWQRIDEGGGHTFTNLPPGDYPIFFKKGDNSYRESYTIGVKNEVKDIEVSAKITNFKSLEDFKIDITFKDNLASYASSGNGYRLVINKYTAYLGKVEVGRRESDREAPATLSVDMETEGSLEVLVTAFGNHIIDGVPSSYERISQLIVPVTADLIDNAYDIEVGTFPSPEYSDDSRLGNLSEAYRPLNNFNSRAFNTDKIKLSGNHYLDVEIQPSYDGTVNVIFAEKNKHIRLINSGFSKQPNNTYEVIDRAGVKDTNQYTTDTVEIATRHVQQVSSVPFLNVVQINNTGGRLEPGMHKFFIKLGTADGNETDIIEETGQIPVFEGDTIGDIKGGFDGVFVNKSVEISVDRIDSNYQYVSLYYVRSSGKDVNTNTYYKVDHKFLLEDSGTQLTSINFVFTGFENKTVISEAELNVLRAPLKSVSTITQLQSRLFVGNIAGVKVDFQKLFKASETIFSYPTSHINGDPVDKIYSNYDSRIESLNLLTYGSVLYNKNLEKTIFNSELNRSLIGRTFKYGNFASVLHNSGFYNPIFAEKFTSYWPAEPYKLAVCWIMDDNTVVNPVPIMSGDYISEAITPSRKTVEKDYKSHLTENPIAFEGRSWVESNGLWYNNLGVMRMPKASSPTSMYYPKIVINKGKLIEKYPDFFSRVKGFFFVRAERRPNVIIAGTLGKCFEAITEYPAANDMYDSGFPDITELSVLKSDSPNGLAAMPFVFEDNNATYKGFRPLGEEIYGTGGLISSNYRIQEETSTMNYPGSGAGIFKYFLESADIYANIPKYNASFIGKTLGFDLIGNFKKVPIFSTTPGGIADSTPYTRFLVLTKLTSFLKAPVTRENKKGILDMIGYGSASRSAGGFGSKIPFKAYKENLPDDHVGLGGMVWDRFIGVSFDSEVEANYAFLYPDKTGPLSSESFRTMYSSDESQEYVPVTSRFNFEEFNNDIDIEVIATRGDCFVTQAIMNRAHGEETPVGSHASTQDKFYDTSSDNEPNEPRNSFRAKEFGAVSMITGHSNYLNFARTPQVEDVLESAKFGKARGFYPLDGAGSGVPSIEHSNKMPSTSGFNKGYAAHFAGRKYISVSKTTPFISNKELGPITKLVSLQDRLISVHENGIINIRVNEDSLLATQANIDVRIKSIDIMQDRSTVLSSKFGSKWPRSIRASDNALYGVDTERGKIWRTVGLKGIEFISDGAVNRVLAAFIRQYKGKNELPGKRYIATHFDSSSNELIFSFYNSDSVFTSRSMDMDPDLYYYLYNSSPEERAEWVTSPEKDEEKVDRKITLKKFDDIYEDEPVKHLTLVYSEQTQTWKTRLSYSPEFLINIKSKLFSINSLDTSSDFDIEKPIYTQADVSSHIFWEHGLQNKLTPTYGSFFGKDSVFEIEFVVNPSVKYSKLFEQFHIIGNESTPSKVIYQVSEHAPWLKTLVNTKGEGYETWEALKDAFFDKVLESGVEAAHPARYYEQSIQDRRYSPVYRANYVYTNGFGAVTIGKNLESLYSFSAGEGAERTPHFLTKVRDNYLKIRLVYNEGKYVYIKGVTTDFKISY
jgi:hypothetical protein